MTTIQVQTKLTLEDLINSLQQLQPDELERVGMETSLLRARRLAPSLSEQEAELLLKINRGIIPDTIRTRCADLTAKAQQETLTKAERKELESVVDEIELLNAERIGYLAQLAQLRQQPLDKLMEGLEIQPLSYE